MLFSPRFSHAYWYIEYGTIGERGPSLSRVRWSITGKIGVVLGATNAGDYVDWFSSVTIPLKKVPQVLRERFGVPPPYCIPPCC